MINLSLEELKMIIKFRKVKDYKRKSKDESIKVLSKPTPKTKEIRKKN